MSEVQTSNEPSMLEKPHTLKHQARHSRHWGKELGKRSPKVPYLTLTTSVRRLDTTPSSYLALDSHDPSTCCLAPE